MARNMKCSVTGKDVHFTAEAADQHAAYHSAKRGQRIGTYQCPSCRHWHLTHRATKPAGEEVRA